MEKKERIVWVDNVKAVAIVLVAFGHLIQSLVKGGIMPSGFGYHAFNQIIYSFHVPLFFICSGFLYQRLTKEQNAKSYCKGVLKKLLAYGVPYIVFSSATYILKLIFSSSVNSEIENSFLYTLFIEPLAPYWFLYLLFLMFLITPIIKSNADGIIRIGLGVAMYMLCAFSLTEHLPAAVYYVGNVLCNNYVWFIMGMAIAYFNFEKHFKPWYFGFFVLFLAVKLYTVYNMINTGAAGLILTFFACAGVIGLICSLYNKNNRQTPVFKVLSGYSMPIFLMHTIFASCVRSVLLKIGVTSLGVHFILGLVASFVLPILAGYIMEKIKLDILYRPTKYIKIK